MAKYVKTPTVEKMFSGNNDLRHIPEGVIVTKTAENINANGTFERTIPISKEDIGYTTTAGKGPFRTTAGATYDITGSLANRTTITKGDPEIFADTPRVGNSAIEVIPRASKTGPGIVIIGDNLTVDSNGRISAMNSYVHPSTHPASMITQDADHRFVTDSEKNNWNGKANTSGVYTGITSGNANKWTNARTITLNGDCSGSVSIDGSSNVTLGVTVANDSHTHSWGNISGKPSTMPNPSNLVIKLNGNTGVTYNGANYGEVNITAGSIGAQVAGSYAPSNHSHNYLPLSGGTINGALTVTGQILSNSDIVAFSDARFKTNLSVIDNPLSKLNEIFGYYYDMQGVDKDRTHQVGLIAQEVAKILPEAIYEDKNGYLGVRYTNIIPLLVEAVKELSERLNAISK